MRRTLTAAAASLSLLIGVSIGGSTAMATVGAAPMPLAVRAPTGPVKLSSRWLSRASRGEPSGCTAAGGNLHCYIPSDIRGAYGVDQLPEKGDGQTIVLVDSYGSPKAAEELAAFHDAFFPDEPAPNFEQIFPIGMPDFSHANPGASGLSGPGAAAGWAGEAALDVQWAYAIAPHAHIVLMAMPPAETLGVQGFPTMFRAIQSAIDTYPAGTIFSMSLGIAEQTFGGAARVQTARFDKVFRAGVEKGDTFFAASGDSGTTGLTKQAKESRSYPFPTTGWPTSSPYVTSVGGTQLQYGWTWDPQSDIPFLANGAFNPAYFNSTAGGHTDVVWNESWLPAATGGGPSAIYPQPSWQAPVSGRIPGDARGVPDLSWNAAVNGAVLVNLQSFLGPDDQGFYLIGGTSAATPQVAALTALANQRRAADGKAPLGLLGPELYSLPSDAFVDVAPVHQGAASVISGDLTSNTMFDYNGDGNPVTVGPIEGWPTLNGWDMTTGFGTPWAPNYVADLAAS